MTAGTADTLVAAPDGRLPAPRTDATAPPAGRGLETWDAVELAGARIEVFADLRACEDLWREATARSACTLFQTYDWIAAWRETLDARAPAAIAIVYVASRDGAPLLLLPLGLFARLGCRRVEFLGGDLCDYNAPIVDRALAERMSRRDVERLWALVLDRLPPFDWVHLRRMPARVDGAPNPLALLDVRPDGAAYAAHLPETYEAFVAARSKSFFAQNRRHRRRLAKAGAVTTIFPDDRDERRAVTDFIVREKAAWQAELGLPRTFASPAYAAFYDRLAQVELSGVEIVTAGLCVDGALTAGLWGVEFRGTFLFLVTSYRPDWASFRVGRLLMEDAIRRCIGRGLAVFDLTTGSEPYKSNWADAATPVFAHLFTRSIRGKLALLSMKLRRRIRTVTAAQFVLNLASRARPNRPAPDRTSEE